MPSLTAVSRAVGALLVTAAVTRCASSPAPPAPTPDRPAALPSAPAPEPAPPPVRTVDATRLGASWRPGCPTPPDELRLVTVPYLDDDGVARRGELVVHADLVADTTAIFDELFALRYPIHRMQTVDAYPGAEDELSMRDNNTSAFNCRPLPSGRWSLHATGRAIDVNPLVNPYLDGAGDLQPATAGRYLDRSRDAPGLLRDGDPAVRAFTGRGWTWGGTWRDPVDYQHFERP
ncbi:M15 family metallopeptidase [Mycobacterium sp. MYCO198283]|uniref:M15 family metallopeptidase n=1 Tax=Mycobacterium sp. MYCO198283 TaxID=2883505 RepID=UPI001E454102|nr:M15 family metallopeptidase [Mycobacterium sp. MYCO198283]MCG5431424.1 M15 family metallopeptidase [Mycobacterium sp. MYCO198283]